MQFPSANQIRRQYIDFFVKNYAHKEIPSASLIPENDPTVLFTTAGMHPLVPFLMGEPHPTSRRLVNSQKCVRTDDIDEVGDTTHLTFFEMLGNWSLGDYFKKEAIEMSFRLLTLPWKDGGFGLDINRLSVSCFEGDNDAPQDLESAEIWQKMGIPKERIYFYPKSKNWWGPAGQTGPCGPDTEMFFDVVNDPDPTKHKEGGKISQPKCEPSCDCGRYVEVWNDVFMQYNKIGPGKFEPLKQKNVDTGLGFERLVAILQGKETHFETELFLSAKEKIESLALSFKKENVEHARSVRIMLDHLRAATFIMGDPQGVIPSNVDQGYIVRRLIRRAVRHARKIGIKTMVRLSKDHVSPPVMPDIAKIFIDIYKEVYPELDKNRGRILTELEQEERRFSLTLTKGLNTLRKMLDEQKGKSVMSGTEAFYIFETYGFPLEMIEEELAKEGFTVAREEFQKAFDEAYKKHQEMSRAGAEQKFAGGLADHSEQSKMHHTATHLLHQALRDVLGTHVFQKGSNITRERLRFDFSHSIKMTPEELKKVEDIINTQIECDIPVHFEVLDVEDAKKRGAIGLFDDKYASLGNKVKVYFMGDYSREVCGGPHVEHTGILKHFKILREEACSSGVRRIKAVVEGIKDVI